MAVYSMTGYAGTTFPSQTEVLSGRSLEAAHTKTESTACQAVYVELRSVNSRFLDLVFRIPDEWRGLEPTLRDLLSQSLKRGKVEVRLSSRSQFSTDWPTPSMDQLIRMSRLESSVQAWLPKASGLSVHEALLWLKSGASAPPAEDLVIEAVKQAILGLLDSRAREGGRLVDVLKERIQRLWALTDQAEPLIPVAVHRQQQKFLLRWREALDLSNSVQSIAPEALQERAIHEAATFAVRVDIAEELARLRTHLGEMSRLLNQGGEVGKRLDFLIQELLREANTLGSKAASIELTSISLEMKVLIEQLREQVQNLE